MIRKVETRFSSLGQVVTGAVLLNLTILSDSPLLLLDSGEYCDDVCIPRACIHQLAVYERLYNSLKSLGIKNKLVHNCYCYVRIDQQLS